jgi:aminopeptidase N
MRLRYFLPIVLLTFSCSRGQALFPNGWQGEARNKTYHVLHYNIEVSFDEPKKTVFGKVTTTLVPLLPEIRSIAFDAEEMTFKKVMLGKKEEPFDVEPKSIVINLDKAYSFNDTLTFTIEYQCTPHRGLYFIQPDSSNPHRPWQIWTQGENEDNHCWFPCYDFPNDKATSELTATVPDSFTVLSNGSLVSVKEDKKDKTKTFHWAEHKPQSSYLIMMAAGVYSILKDSAGTVPLEYYVYPNEVEDAKICFQETPAIMNFYNRKIGFPFAWEKYAQIIIADFMYGGMENTTATTLNDDRTVYGARARVDNNPVSLIAHEMAHQWWGDVVTCKDWQEIWLNESFASYFDPMYIEYSRGEDEFDYVMYHDQLDGIRSDEINGRKPIVSPASFTQNIYPRGAEVLHMLRFVLGDQLFWRALRHYITKNQFTPVETYDLKEAIEEETGQNLYWFFDEWVFKAGYPVFDVSYQWSDSAKEIFLHVTQTQKQDSLTGIFQTPVDIGITTSDGESTQKVLIMSGDTTFAIHSPEKPLLVIFDKGNWILKELHFHKSDEEWKYQAVSAKNPIDRIYALKELETRDHNEQYIPQFADRALRDPFWGVRLEAVNSFGFIPKPDSASSSTIKTTILTACRDKNPKVRAAAIHQLDAFRGDDVLQELLFAMHTDSSYDVVASAIRSYAKADTESAWKVLIGFLNYPSYFGTVESAALESLSELDTVKVVPLALEKAGNDQNWRLRYVSFGILRRYGANNPKVLDFFGNVVNDSNNEVRMRTFAASVLGSIGNHESISLLEKVVDTSRQDELIKAAKSSIEKIEKRLHEKS